MTNLSWKERYVESLKESLTVNGIRRLRNVSTSEALMIRRKAIEHLKNVSNDPNFEEPKTRIDIVAVFAVTGHDQDYYYKKMIAERKAEA